MQKSSVKICSPMSRNSTSDSKRILLNKEVMAAEDIKGIVKVMVVVVDTADMAASIPQQVLLPLNHLRQVHLEPLARQIIVHNMPNITVLVARIPTQLMVVIKTMWRRIINTTHSKPHNNRPHRGPPLPLHQAMNLRLPHLQAALLPALMVATIQWVQSKPICGNFRSHMLTRL